MKTKHWIALLAVLLIVCIAASMFLLRPGKSADYAEIISQGRVIRTVDLRLDQEFTVELEDGNFNTVTVREGKIAVTAASCPDQYCAKRGWCAGGAQIVCLPNGLVIRFTGTQEADIAAG